MKRLILWISLCLGLGLAMSYIYQKYTHLFGSFKQADNKEYENNRQKAIHELRTLEFNNQGKELNLSIICQSIEGKTYTLHNICGGKNKLVFCIPAGVCNTCHENTFQAINKIARIIGSENLLVLVDSPRLRATVVEFNERQSHLKILGVAYKELNVRIQYVPFFFVMTANSALSNLFAPNSFDPELTNKYAYAVKERYFSK